jgi:hypothetical protein
VGAKGVYERRPLDARKPSDRLFLNLDLSANFYEMFRRNVEQVRPNAPKINFSKFAEILKIFVDIMNHCAT